MRHIKLVFDEKKFKILKDKKEDVENVSSERLSWEDFIYKQVLK